MYRGLNIVHCNGLTVARNKIRGFPHMGVNINSVTNLRFVGNEVSECVAHATYAAQNMVTLATVTGDTIAEICDNEFRKTSGTAARMALISNASATNWAYSGNRYETTGATISTAVDTLSTRPTVTLRIGDDQFDKGHPTIGTRHVWFDSNGIPRYKASAPSTHVDGAGLGQRPAATTSTNQNPIAPNSDTAQKLYVTALGQNVSVSAPSGTPVAGQDLELWIRDDGTIRTLTWNAAYVPIGVTLPTATTAGKWHRVKATYNATASAWHVTEVNVEA